MLRTNNNNNNNHINGWPATRTNGDTKPPSSASAPLKSLREEYFSNGNTTNGEALKNNNNNHHQINNNLNGWSGASPQKSNGNGLSYASSPVKQQPPSAPTAENNNYHHNANDGERQYTDDAPATGGAEKEPAEEDQLIVRNHQMNGNGHGVQTPPIPTTNGHHHLHGNLRLMNGKVNGSLAPNGATKQANGNGTGIPAEKECDESDPLTGTLTGDTMKRRLEESDDEDSEVARMRKEQANGLTPGGHPGPDGDEDDDRICGIGACRPKWATKLASTKVFMVVFLLAWVLQGMYSTYFVSVITTIEKLFQIQSKVTGMLLSVTEIGQISTALFLTYYAGRGHRPRWIACGKCFVHERRQGFVQWLPPDGWMVGEISPACRCSFGERHNRTGQRSERMELGSQVRSLAQFQCINLGNIDFHAIQG